MSYDLHFIPLIEIFKEIYIPKDIYAQILSLLSNHICGYCKKYLLYGYIICDICLLNVINKQQTKISNLMNKNSQNQVDINFWKPFIASEEQCKLKIETYNKEIDEKLFPMKNKFDILDKQLSTKKSHLEKIETKSKYYNELLGIDIKNYNSEYYKIKNEIVDIQNEILPLYKDIHALESTKLGRYISMSNTNGYSFGTLTIGEIMKKIEHTQRSYYSNEYTIDEINKKIKKLQTLQLYQKYYNQYKYFAEINNINWDSYDIIDSCSKVDYYCKTNSIILID